MATPIAIKSSPAEARTYHVAITYNVQGDAGGVGALEHTLHQETGRVMDAGAVGLASALVWFDHLIYGDVGCVVTNDCVLYNQVHGNPYFDVTGNAQFVSEDISVKFTSAEVSP